MVFRRRDRRSPWRTLREAVWPRGGWGRAIEYIKHRLRRLPDSPEKIGRGMAAGVLISFTPLYGLHFLGGLALAWALRGNSLAALIGTFVNNFVTLVPITALALGLGYWILGLPMEEGLLESFGHLVAEAGWDLWNNALAPFTARQAEWTGLVDFWRRAFWPYLVGGLAPGLLAAAASYWLTVPLIRAYQSARRKALQEKLARLRRPGGIE